MSLLKNNGYATHLTFDVYFYCACCRELAGRTVLVMDASKGIGKAIAVKAAQDGANVVIASPNATREETIYTAAKEGSVCCSWALRKIAKLTLSYF